MNSNKPDIEHSFSESSNYLNNLNTALSTYAFLDYSWFRLFGILGLFISGFMFFCTSLTVILHPERFVITVIDIGISSLLLYLSYLLIERSYISPNIFILWSLCLGFVVFWNFTTTQMVDFERFSIQL